MNLVVVAPNLSGADQKRPDQYPPCVSLVGEDRRSQVGPAFLCREAILRTQQEAQERRGPDPGYG